MRAPRTVDEIVAAHRAKSASVDRLQKAHVDSQAWRPASKQSPSDLAAAQAALTVVAKPDRADITAVHIQKSNGWVRFTMRTGPDRLIDPTTAPAAAAARGPQRRVIDPSFASHG